MFNSLFESVFYTKDTFTQLLTGESSTKNTVTETITQQLQLLKAVI